MKGTRFLRAVCIFILLLSIVSGCSYFKERRRVNLAPFAENTIALTADIQYGLSQFHPVYLYHHLDGPKVEVLVQRWKRLRRILGGVMAYSIEVVTISESTISRAEQAEELANFLDNLLRPVLEQPRPRLHMTVSKFDTILTNVRSQKEFLPALNAAQPIIDEISRSTLEYLETIRDARDEAVDEVTMKIEEEHGGIKKYVSELKKGQIEILDQIGFLMAYRRGNKAAMDSLLAQAPSLREVVESPSHITDKDLKAIEDRLIYILSTIGAAKKQLEPDLENYRNQKREIDEILNISDTAITKSKVAIIVWARAHRKLSSGVIDPARINLFDLSKKAMKTII